MGRFEEGLESHIEESMRIGRDNAECKRHMEEWCQHVEIRPESVGELAMVYELPIGLYSLECPKIESKASSSVFRSTFGEFLEQHCANCPHHAPNGDISWGQEIIELRQKEAQESEQAANEEVDRISQLRSELRVQSQEINSETEPESYHILTYLGMIFSEDEAERTGASLRLQESAMLGADLFPEAAINLILLLAGTSDYAELILPICVGLAGRRSEYDPRFVQVALNNIEKKLHPEPSASILIALGEYIRYPLREVHIKRLLLAYEHSFLPRGFPFNEEPDYSHSTEVLIRCYDADPESVLRIIRPELQNEKDYVRFQLCSAIELIQTERPQLAENLLNDLVRSLELSEDTFGGVAQPSHKINGILQSLFRYSVEKVDEALADSMTSAPPAVQEDIVNVYRGQFFEESTDSDAVMAATQRLLTWVKDDRLELTVRIHIADALQTACQNAATETLGHFDSLLGYLALIGGQTQPPIPQPQILLPYQEQSPAPQVEHLENLSRNSRWEAFKAKLQECLEAICKAYPSETFDSVFNRLNRPPEHLEKDFKARCMTLLGVLGRNFPLRGRVLPLIWHGLMDSESAWVQAKAIDAAVEMFSSSTTSPPANMVDTILVHLRDPKVVVHQAVWRVVMRRLRWFDREQAEEALTCLGDYLNPYYDKKYRLKDICVAILNIGRREQHLRLLALRMAESVFPTGEKYVDKDLVESMMRLCEPDEKIAGLVATNIGTYLDRYRREPHYEYRYSERLPMFEWLHELPAPTFQYVADDLLASAMEVAKRDYWEACYFASLFAHFRAFRYEQNVLETAISALPDEPRHERLRALLRTFAKAAAGNASLQVGKGNSAETHFREIRAEA